VIGRGPDFVRRFIEQPHDNSEFAPDFSWLALADSVGLRYSLTRDTNPTLAARWAEIAATLYEGLARGARPQDDLARDIWTRKAAHYRAVGVQLTPRVGTAPDAHDPRPV
jgi:hypothetical protein